MSDAPTVSPWRRRFEIGLGVFGFVLVLGMVALVVAPVFKPPLDTYGSHDWDPMQAHRFLLVKTIKDFHQLPFWNPYNCGGHTWWGGLESGTNFVSPWVPFYLFMPLMLAIRCEIAGTAAIGAIGSWALAGRFTKSTGAKLICAAVFLSGRWGLQAGAGHAWHLYYAWTPWAFYFFDRALAMQPPVTKSPRREVILFASTMAMMVYSGAIYPLPQTAVALLLYAIACAVATRTLRPLLVLAGGGVLAVALAAPRLLPLIDTVRRFPRLTDSPEMLDLAGFVGVFTAKESDPHPNVYPWGWHEWGIYIGWIPFLAMLAAIVLARRARERALVFTGVCLLVLGFGRFSTYAPWALMHDHLPVFASQHVPSRWLYPASMLLVVAAVAIIERWVARFTKRTWLEVAYLFVGAYVALGIGLESQKPLVNAFIRHLPPMADSTGPFHMERTTPARMQYDAPDWAPSSLPVMIANIGAQDCATFAGLHSYYKDRTGRVEGSGARGVGDPEYHGEVYLASGAGHADVVAWSPNAVTVSVRGASPGDVLVLNQNWDPGWRAQGQAAIAFRDAVATNVGARDAEITFRYVPRFLGIGCLLLLMAIAFLVLTTQRRASK